MMRDGELDLYAFYAVRGYDLAHLAALTPLELIFLDAAREKYIDSINRMTGGGGDGGI